MKSTKWFVIFEYEGTRLEHEVFDTKREAEDYADGLQNDPNLLYYEIQERPADFYGDCDDEEEADEE